MLELLNLPHSMTFYALTSFRKVSHRHPVRCGMSIERLEEKTEMGSWWKESV